MTHSPYPIPQLPHHLQHALSNIWAKPHLPFTLQGPLSLENPHVMFLERVYFCAQGKAVHLPPGPAKLQRQPKRKHQADVSDLKAQRFASVLALRMPQGYVGP